MFRRLFLAILVIALPLQGVASATMSHCGSSQHHQAHGTFGDWFASTHAHDAHSMHSSVDTATIDAGHGDHNHAPPHLASNGDQDHQRSHHSGSNDSSHHGDQPDCCAATVALATSLPVSFPAAGPPAASPY